MGLNGIGATVPPTAEVTKGQRLAATVEGGDSRTPQQAVARDQLRKSVRILSPAEFSPVTFGSFKKDSKAEAQELIDSLLGVVRANRGNWCGTPVMMANMEFPQRVRSTSTAGLKESLQLLAAEETRVRKLLKGYTGSLDEVEALHSDLKIIDHMRKTIQNQLDARLPLFNDTEAEALVDSVADTKEARQLEALSRFSCQAMGVSWETLKHMRELLIERMASESDPDQGLIYKMMLHSVSTELHNRGVDGKHFHFPGCGHGGPMYRPPALDLTREEYSRLRVRLEAADAGTRNAICYQFGISDSYRFRY